MLCRLTAKLRHQDVQATISLTIGEATTTKDKASQAEAETHSTAMNVNRSSAGCVDLLIIRTLSVVNVRPGQDVIGSNDVANERVIKAPAIRSKHLLMLLLHQHLMLMTSL